jgi:hypothetical protein
MNMPIIAIPNNNVADVEGVKYGCFSYTHRLNPPTISATILKRVSIVWEGFFISRPLYAVERYKQLLKSQWQQRVTFKIRLIKVRAMSSLTTRDKHTERKKIKRPRCNGVILRVDSLRVWNKCLSNMLGCKGRGIE